MRFYGIEPAALMNAETWILDALARNLTKLQAEERLFETQLWLLFGRQPQKKGEAATLRQKQRAFIRRLKKQLELNDPVEKKKEEEVEVIDPSTLNEEQRARIREWAASQGIEAQ